MKNLFLNAVLITLGILAFQDVQADLPPEALTKKSIPHELKILIEGQTIYATLDISSEASHSLAQISEFKTGEPFEHKIASQLHFKTLGNSPLIVRNDICRWKSIGAKSLGKIQEKDNKYIVRIWGVAICPEFEDFMSWDVVFMNKLFPPSDLNVEITQNGFIRKITYAPGAPATTVDLIRPSFFGRNWLLPIKQFFTPPKGFDIASLSVNILLIINLIFLYLVVTLYSKPIAWLKVLAAMFFGQSIALLLQVRNFTVTPYVPMWLEAVPLVSLALVACFGLWSFGQGKKFQAKLDKVLMFSILFGACIGLRFFPLIIPEVAGRTAAIFTASALSLGIVSVSALEIGGILAYRRLESILEKKGMSKAIALWVLIILYVIILAMFKGNEPPFKMPG